MNDAFKTHLQQQINEISESGLYKAEHPLTTAQGARVEVEGQEGKGALNFCANNYLGLAQNPEIRDAAIQGLKDWGYGLASVRFICGTQSIHTQLECALSSFLKTDSTI